MRVRLGQVRLGQVRLGQVRLGQVRLGQFLFGQVRLGQFRLSYVRLGQFRLGQVRLVQVRLGQVRFCHGAPQPSVTHFMENLTFTGQCIVIYFYNKPNMMHQFLKFSLFFSSILQVSKALSVHHLESKTKHTASGICQTDSVDCLLAGTR